MLPVFLMTPGQTTIKAAAMLAMIAYKSSNVHDTRTICSEQCKENLRLKFALKGSIPYSQALLLQRDQVLQSREEK